MVPFIPAQIPPQPCFPVPPFHFGKNKIANLGMKPISILFYYPYILLILYYNLFQIICIMSQKIYAYRNAANLVIQITPTAANL